MGTAQLSLADDPDLVDLADEDDPDDEELAEDVIPERKGRERFIAVLHVVHDLHKEDPELTDAEWAERLRLIGVDVATVEVVDYRKIKRGKRNEPRP